MSVRCVLLVLTLVASAHGGEFPSSLIENVKKCLSDENLDSLERIGVVAELIKYYEDNPKTAEGALALILAYDVDYDVPADKRKMFTSQGLVDKYLNGVKSEPEQRWAYGFLLLKRIDAGQHDQSLSVEKQIDLLEDNKGEVEVMNTIPKSLLAELSKIFPASDVPGAQIYWYLSVRYGRKGFSEREMDYLKAILNTFPGTKMAERASARIYALKLGAK